VSKRIPSIGEFFELDAAGGILLVAASILAMFLANTPVSKYYDLLIAVPVTIAVADFQISKPLLLWINDGLMAVFFLYVGLELKREILEGELSEINKVTLPVAGAIGGMLVPAGIYLLLTFHNPVAVKGWAIPAATDIAFALGILALLGSRVPASLKVFLTSLAILDDLGAILIIAFFYTSKISILALLFGVFCVIILFVLNRRRVNQISPYVLVGLLMWLALLKSGVHATLAGVILAMFIPMHGEGENGKSLLRGLEHDLHPIVTFFILPVFAFANAGVNLHGVTMELMLHDVTIAIACGLFVGKQLGIFLFCWLAIRTGLAHLPESMSYRSLYGTAVLCGVGFTMSLFIGTLAFEETGVNILFDERIGIIAGSLCSGVLGYLILNSTLRGEQQVSGLPGGV
jgi:NhaA family Na+:H+ antiporter